MKPPNDIEFLPDRDDFVTSYDVDSEIRVFVSETDNTEEFGELETEILIGEETVCVETSDDGLLGSYRVVAEFMADLND